MILPKSLLEQVAYYETSLVEGTYGWYTKIILHFKQWWKPRKVFKISWRMVERQGDISMWEESQCSRSLQHQLADYFKDK